MPMPRSLLVPTDLSTAGRHAALRAAMLAREIGARLELLHVVEAGALAQLRQLLGGGNDAVETRMLAQTDAQLAALARDIQSTHGVTAKTHRTEGQLLPSITARATAIDADLMVLGASSAGYLRHWLIGATAERLLHKTRQPMLFVRQAPHQPYRTLLVSIDFSPGSARTITLAQQLNPKAHLILMHACELPFEGKMRFAGVSDEAVLQYRQTIRQEALLRLQSLATDTGLDPARWRPVITHGDPVQDIVQQQLDLDADLVVAGKHGAGMTQEWLLGSVTQQLLGRVQSDVLVTVDQDPDGAVCASPSASSR